ncbi:MAG: hypothetical protein IMY87_07075 [Chloroflexi bacterium]|jgi:hypothetical protein|nr:hypothetical protein [Chloroflexota bacterium]
MNSPRYSASAAWNRCVTALARLREEANEVVSNFLDGIPTMPDLLERIDSSVGIFEGKRQMLKGVIQATWVHIQAGALDHARVQFGTMPELGGRFSVKIEGIVLPLEFTNKDVANAVATVCGQATDILCRGYNVREIAQQLPIIAKKAAEIEEMLDPMSLRPLILRTRCDLCPA